MVTGQHAPQRGMLLSLACSPMWHAPQSGMLPNVACSPVWHAPQRGMSLSVACAPMWHPPQRGIFLSRPLWSCSVRLCTQRRCKAYWPWSGKIHIRESRG